MSRLRPDCDEVLSAWGETTSWRVGILRAQWLSGVPAPLIQWSSGSVFGVVDALSHAQGMREHMVREIDEVLPQGRLPYLHRAMRMARSADHGPRRWRRHWIVRCLRIGEIVQGEAAALRLVIVRLEACRRALQRMRAVVERASALPGPMDDDRLATQWQVLVAGLDEAKQDLASLNDCVDKLVLSTRVLSSKATLFVEVCHAAPYNEDLVGSQTLACAMKKLLAVPPSGFPGARE